MRRDALSLTALIMSLGVLPAGAAELSAELADVGIRIDYGFYAEEYAVIEGARGTLERMSSEDAIVDYYRGFASLRLAQLAAQYGRPLGDSIDDCSRHPNRRSNVNPPCSVLALDRIMRRVGSFVLWVIRFGTLAPGFGGAEPA